MYVAETKEKADRDNSPERKPSTKNIIRRSGGYPPLAKEYT